MATSDEDKWTFRMLNLATFASLFRKFEYLSSISIAPRWPIQPFSWNNPYHVQSRPVPLYSSLVSQTKCIRSEEPQKIWTNFFCNEDFSVPRLTQVRMGIGVLYSLIVWGDLLYFSTIPLSFAVMYMNIILDAIFISRSCRTCILPRLHIWKKRKTFLKIMIVVSMLC